LLIHRQLSRLVASLLLALPALAGCGGPGSAGGTLAHVAAPVSSMQATPVVVTRATLALPKQPCAGSFVEHSLPYTTTAGVDTMFESNGTGLAIGDLDGDGQPDIIFANLKGPNAILWNRGDLQWQKEEFPAGDSRDVSIVDVDGDGLLDIVFTHRTTAPTFWRNTGHGNGLARFVEEALPEVDQKLYAINWIDIDGDGDLDFVGGSYDAALEKDLGYQWISTRSGGGVYLFERAGAGFVAHRLSQEAQTLAIAFPDWNEDGRRDILIGNDFGTPDQAWQWTPGGWQEAHPFKQTTHSTMSFDLGDIDNSGRDALFATDMKPYDQDIRTLARWRPMMTKMPHDTAIGDRQIMENVLQTPDGRGNFSNQAYARSVDATGWSWSAKFGDLDNDGWLDLYVVNGMLAADLFGYLPAHELVEENRAFRNEGQGAFKLAPEWGLGSRRGGRSMSMADLDNDGDLDIVINNFESPAQIFENRLCGGQSLEADLLWPASKNSRAIGATLTLHTSAGSFRRDVRASSGYLSGDPARVHWGFPSGTTIQRLEITWPDGMRSTVEHLTPHSLVTIKR
jgi:hypothetical protein